MVKISRALLFCGSTRKVEILNETISVDALDIFRAKLKEKYNADTVALSYEEL